MPLQNIYDDSIEFEPIDRVLFDVDEQAFTKHVAINVLAIIR